jgi:hypothetical protein
VKAIHHANLDVSAVAVLARLGDPASWPEVIGGLTVEEIVPDPRVPERCEVALRFEDPRPFRLRLQVGRHSSGISVLLVHGDLSSVDGRFEVVPTATGCALQARLEVYAPFALPGAFRAELEQALLPRWVDAMVATLR